MNHNEKDFTKEQWKIINNLNKYVDDFNKPEFDFVPQELKDKAIRTVEYGEEIKKERAIRNQYYEDVKSDKIVPPEGKKKFIEDYEKIQKTIKELDEKRTERKERFRTFDERCLNPDYLPGGYFTSEEFLTIEKIVDKDINDMFIRHLSLNRYIYFWEMKKFILKNRYKIDWLNPEERYDRGTGRFFRRYLPKGLRNKTDEEFIRKSRALTFYMDFFDETMFEIELNDFHVKNHDKVLETFEKINMRDEIERAWLYFFNLCKEYYIENNNLDIPFDYSVDYVDLGRWLESQKIAHKKDKLPADKVELLETIGIIWN